MKGFYVPRRFGWDCHGLPIENEIEKAHNLVRRTPSKSLALPVLMKSAAKSFCAIRKSGKRLSPAWGAGSILTRPITPWICPLWSRSGGSLKQLYEKGLVYEGFKVMPFSAKLGTPLSNFEAGENYKDVDDPSLTVALQLGR